MVLDTSKGQFPWHNGQIGERTKKLDEWSNYLLRNQTLEDWRGMSLVERVCKLREVSNGECVVTGQTLGNFYRNNGIRNRKVQYTVFTPQTNLAILQQQVYFVKSLAQEMYNGMDVVYFDETTMHLWQKNVKTWHRPEKPIKIRLSQQRSHSVTVFGAIVTNSNRFHHMLVPDGTTADNTLQFMK